MSGSLTKPVDLHEAWRRIKSLKKEEAIWLFLGRGGVVVWKTTPRSSLRGIRYMLEHGVHIGTYRNRKPFTTFKRLKADWEEAVWEYGRDGGSLEAVESIEGAKEA
jgi:hypothetical protein